MTAQDYKSSMTGFIQFEVTEVELIEDFDAQRVIRHLAAFILTR